MVYQNKFVAAVKVGGRVLREHDGAVYVPFGSEYSLLLKNLDAVRAKVKVSIDGADATESTWLVVEPNTSMELERFIKNGRLDKGNRFKFIERTGAVEAHRGIKADDGLVRIEVQAEIPQPVTTFFPSPFYQGGNLNYPPGVRGSGLMRSSNFMAMHHDVGPAQGAAGSSSFMGFDEVERGNVTKTSDPGITVPGSISNQQFRHVDDFVSGPSQVIVLALRGREAGRTVTKAITVSTNVRCDQCGRWNKTTDRFCATCGAGVERV